MQRIQLHIWKVPLSYTFRGRKYCDLIPLWYTGHRVGILESRFSAWCLLQDNLHEVASVLWCGIDLLAVSVKEDLEYFFHWLASSCWSIALVKTRCWEVTAMCQMSRSYSSRLFV